MNHRNTQQHDTVLAEEAAEGQKHYLLTFALFTSQVAPSRAVVDTVVHLQSEYEWFGYWVIEKKLSQHEWSADDDVVQEMPSTTKIDSSTKVMTRQKLFLMLH
jgi:hypothetical protein